MILHLFLAVMQRLCNVCLLYDVRERATHTTFGWRALSIAIRVVPEFEDGTAADTCAANDAAATVLGGGGRRGGVDHESLRGTAVQHRSCEYTH